MQPTVLRALVLSLNFWLAATALSAQPDLEKIFSEAARFASGASREPLNQIEDALRQSLGNPALRHDLEAALDRMLAATSTFEARRFACQQLAVIGTDASLPELTALLGSDETVGMACLALAPQTSPKVDELLVNALGRLRGNAQAQIVHLLGVRRAAPAVAPLTGLAHQASPILAEAAMSALARIANPPALEALAGLRKDPNPTLAQTALRASLQAAGVLSDETAKTALALYEELLATAEPLDVRRAALAGVLRADPRNEEKRILQVLRGHDAALKPVAIAAVSSLKSRGASTTFARELSTLQPAEQTCLIEALAARADASARSAVLAQLTATDPGVRQAAARALASLGNATSVSGLVKGLLDTRSPEELLTFESALSALPGGVKTDRAVVAAFKGAADQGKVRLTAVLQRRGSPNAVPALLEETGHPAVAKAAFRALGRLGTAENLEVLIGQLSRLKVSAARAEAESAVGRILARSPDPRQYANVILARLAQATEVEARCSLMGLLPGCGGSRALVALKEALADRDQRLRDTALRSLTEWPDASAWDALAEIYQKPGNESERVVVLRGLVRLAGEANAKRDATLIERYRALLAGARSDDDRKLILGALSGCAHPDALPLVLPLVSNAALKAEATLAVRKIADAIKDKHPQAAQQALEDLKR